jgi:hypothetical protein
VLAACLTPVAAVSQCLRVRVSDAQHGRIPLDHGLFDDHSERFDHLERFNYSLADDYGERFDQ